MSLNIIQIFHRGVRRFESVTRHMFHFAGHMNDRLVFRDFGPFNRIPKVRRVTVQCLSCWGSIVLLSCVTSEQLRWIVFITCTNELT